MSKNNSLFKANLQTKYQTSHWIWGKFFADNGTIRPVNLTEFQWHSYFSKFVWVFNRLNVISKTKSSLNRRSCFWSAIHLGVGVTLWRHGATRNDATPSPSRTRLLLPRRPTRRWTLFHWKSSQTSSITPIQIPLRWSLCSTKSQRIRKSASF